MILNICNNADVLRVMRIINIVITIIKIAVPIVLIISIMISYVSAVKNNDDDALVKANKAVVPKVIAAIIVFFIPTFVKLITDIVDKNNNSYLSCLKLATKENIDYANYETALEKINAAKKTLSDGDYNVAVSYINKIKSADLKSKATEKLNEVKEYISIKNELYSLQKAYDKKKYQELYNRIQNIYDYTVKEKFEKILKELGLGKPLNLPSGLSALKKYSNMNYYEVIPNNPTTNMALWIFLHGDGGLKTSGLTSFISSGKAYTKEEFFYIAPSPVNFNADWTTEPIPSNLKKLIDYIVKQYEIDTDRIIISGESRGAIGTWKMVNNYPNLFSVAFPISCRPVGVKAKNFTSTIIRAHVGDLCGASNGYECVYIDDMRKLVNEVSKLGGDATLTIHKGKAHGQSTYVLKEADTINFALSQTKKR